MSKNTLQKNTITKKEFSYQKDTVSLNFTLNIENRDELSNFKECLIEAIKDIEETMAK